MLAIIVLAHRDPEQLVALLASLRHPNVRIYVHVDSGAASGAAPASFRAAAESAGIHDVVWLRPRRTRWGGIEIIDVEIDAISRAVADGCEYLMMISGQDFPLRPIGELVEFAATRRQDTFIEHFTLPYEHWPFGGRSRTDFYAYTFLARRDTCIPRGEDTSTLNLRGRLFNTALRVRSAFKPPRQFPDYVTPVGGQHWMNLSRKALEFILEFIRQHPDYRRYHEHTMSPDELFFQSIVLGSSYATNHSVINDDLRFMVWRDRGDNHPRELTFADLPDMLASSDLFARKLSATHQPDLLAALQAWVSGQ